MTTLSSDLPDNPFVAGPMITDPRLFVGRRRELAKLFNLMQQPVSANVTGERRIGKSCLLYHVYQTWELRVQEPQRYCVVYLDLQDAQCDRETYFYKAVLQALRQRLQSNSLLAGALTSAISSANRQNFSSALRQCHQENILPVLCLDEFEALFEHTDQFDDGFFDSLRSLMNANQVMLILASRKSLDVYKRKHRLTSDFFNLGQVVPIGELELDEVAALLRLPAAPPLGALEQDKAKEWGGKHPCRLQLAANFLWQAGKYGYGEKWAWQQFVFEERRLPTRRARTNPIHAVKSLGQLAQRIGNKLDDFSNLVVGTVIIVAVLLGIFGVFHWTEMKELLEKALG